MKVLCPGFASYRFLSNDQVEVNGSVPVFPEGPYRKKLLALWDKFGSYVLQASRKHDVPAAWLMGIMLQESGGDPNACSPCNMEWCPGVLRHGGSCGGPCCAYGLMQFIDSTARSFGRTGPSLLGDPGASIDMAAQYVKQLEKRYGKDLVRIAGAYNGVTKCSGKGTFGLGGQGDYSMKIAKGANTFVQMGSDGAIPGVSPRRFSLDALLALGLVAGAAYVGYTYYDKGKFPWE